MDVATERAGRLHQRPTQAYYVPPRRIPCSLPPATNKKEEGIPAERCTTNQRAEGLREKPSDKGKRRPDEQTRGTPNTQKSPESRQTSVRASKQQVAKPKTPLVSPSDTRKTSTSPRPLDNHEETVISAAKAETPVVNYREPMEKIHSPNNTQKPKQSSPRQEKKPAPPALHFDPNAPILSTPEKEGTCICERAPCHLYCKRCSYECMGRLMRVCPTHPTRMSLMDLRECPNTLCRSVQLIELSDK
ncbi:unnamed protein product, partial [Mesorhabditis spiculigera]